MEESPEQIRPEPYPLLLHLGILFLFSMAGMYLGQYALQTLLEWNTGLSLETVLAETREGQGKDASWILLLQALNQILGFGFSVFLCGYFTGDISALVPLRFPRPGVYVYVLVLIACIIPVVPLLTLDADSFVLPEAFREVEMMLEKAESEAEGLIYALLGSEAAQNKGIQILIFALIPAVCEELFFRGAVQKFFSSRFGPHAGIWMTGLLFSLIHFQVYGFIPRFLLGVLFGYLVYWTGSLLPAVWGHFVFNTSSLFLSYSGERDATTEIPVWISLISLLATILILYLLRSRYFSGNSYESEY